mmetsp:Transcript_48517/g.140557  ORF Transcript_48517/g.140557 Transcript_48517/m.140557 type:complete len:239 (+) Transcript_48517:302-1018(+)
MNSSSVIRPSLSSSTSLNMALALISGNFLKNFLASSFVSRLFPSKSIRLYKASTLALSSVDSPVRVTVSNMTVGSGENTLPLSGGIKPQRTLSAGLTAGMEVLLRIGCCDTEEETFLGSTVGVPRRSEPGPSPFTLYIRTEEAFAGCCSSSPKCPWAAVLDPTICIAERDIVDTRCRMAGTSLFLLLTMSLKVSRARLLSLGLQCTVVAEEDLAKTAIAWGVAGQLHPVQPTSLPCCL